MDRDTRDKFVASTDQEDLLYGESACLETPPDLFAALHEEFHFDVDLCANEQNHLLPIWFGPGSPVGNGQDALANHWYFVPTVHQEQSQHFSPTTRGFANPPYGKFVSKIIPKAIKEAEQGFLSVFLLPVRINHTFKRLILPYADIRFVDERIKFWYQGVPKLNPNTQKHDGALFDSMLAIFRPRHPGMLFFPKPPEVWTWKNPAGSK